MTEWKQRIAAFFGKYLGDLYLPHIRFIDVIEIVIVAVVIYRDHALDQEYKSMDAASRTADTGRLHSDRSRF